MAKNADKQEPAIKHFKQVGSKPFKTYEAADIHRKSLSVTADEKVRVKYRRSRNEYDVVLFQK